MFLARLAQSGMPKDGSKRMIPPNPKGKTAVKSARPKATLRSGFNATSDQEQRFIHGP